LPFENSPGRDRLSAARAKVPSHAKAKRPWIRGKNSLRMLGKCSGRSQIEIGAVTFGLRDQGLAHYGVEIIINICSHLIHICFHSAQRSGLEIRNPLKLRQEKNPNLFRVAHQKSLDEKIIRDCTSRENFSQNRDLVDREIRIARDSAH